MVEIFVLSCVTALVLFFGFLGFRVFKTVRKLRSPANLSPSPGGLKPDDKMLRTAAKMGGISVQEARRRLGVAEPSPTITATPVVPDTRSPGSAPVYAGSSPRPTGKGRSSNAKARKRRKAANRSRAINRNKRKK